jgi:protein-tyrosine phosphatase
MNLEPRLADPSQAGAIARLRDDLAEYQAEQGFPQWRPGEITGEQFARQIEAGEWFVLIDAATLTGTVRIIWDDPVIWPEGGEAGHIHGLMVQRSRMGQGIGSHLLSWAEQHIRDQGKPLARLDCAATSQSLRSFYRRRGYIEIGEFRFPPGLPYTAAMRFEKSLA